MGPYGSLHTENPESPYYTESGALEAGYSNLTEGGGHTEIAAIDSWWTAPFHAIGMLRPQLTKVELGYRAASGDAGLDVIQGLDFSIAKPSSPVLFPGAGVTTNLAEFNGGELPTPLETCGWQSLGTVGLPIIALLPEPPEAGLTASVLGPAGDETSTNGEACVVDEHTYFSSDPIYGEDGREILAGEDAVLVIPRHPLADGSYQVDIQQPGRADIAWSFSVDRPAGELEESDEPPFAGEPRTGVGVSSTPTSYTYSEAVSTGSSEPSPGDFYLGLTIRHGRALVRIPGWAPLGLPFKSSVYKQRRVCHRHPTRCSWSTIASSSALRHTSGSTASFALGFQPSRVSRVKVVVDVLPFSLGSWSYPETRTTRIVGPSG